MFFIRGFLKSKEYIDLRTHDRYDLIKSNCTPSPALTQYIESHVNRTAQYKQVYWLIIDALPIYVLRFNPQTSKVTLLFNYRTQL